MILLLTIPNIPLSYDSINGTVNSVDTVFIKDIIVDNLLMCYCETADTYAVTVNFTLEGTTVYTFSDTITQDINSFILDRTPMDVARVKYLRDKGYSNLTPAELSEWDTDLKGALNQSDIIRTLFNVDTVSMLDDLPIPGIVAPNIWEGSFFATMLSAISDIREVGFITETTPYVPERPLNGWDKWNNLEQILFDNYDIRTTQFKYFGGSSEFPLPQTTELPNMVFFSDNEPKKLDVLEEFLLFPFLLGGQTQNFVQALNDIKRLQEEVLTNQPFGTESGDNYLATEDGNILITEV